METICYAQLDDWTKEVFFDGEENSRDDILYSRHVEHYEEFVEILRWLQATWATHLISKQVNRILGNTWNTDTRI